MQKRPVGVEAHPFGWGKHRVRLYAARTRRGAAPAPPAPKGEKSAISKATIALTSQSKPQPPLYGFVYGNTRPYFQTRSSPQRELM